MPASTTVSGAAVALMRYALILLLTMAVLPATAQAQELLQPEDAF